MSADSTFVARLSTLLAKHESECTVESLFPTNPDTVEYYKKFPAEFKNSYGQRVSCELAHGNRAYSIQIRSGKKSLRLCLERDPKCCGIGYIHTFSTAGFTQEVFEILLDAVLSYNSNEWQMDASRNHRLIINMIETGSQSRRSFIPTEHYDPLPDQEMMYNEFYVYFKKKCKKINEMLMPNANSGNIIHHMELLF